MGVEPLQPQYVVIVACQDITDIVDIDSMKRILSERGEASATIEILVENENEIPVNGLERDAVVDIWVDGDREWLGKIVGIHKPRPEALEWVLDCAGFWSDLTHADHWCKGFVETRMDVVEYPARLYDVATGGGFKVMTALDLNTDSQIQWTLPKGSKVKIGQSRVSYVWPLGGMAPGLVIERITGTVTCGGSDNLSASIVAATDDPFDGGADTLTVASYLSDASQSGTFDVTDFSLLSGDPTHLRLWAYSPSDITETTGEEFIQIRNLRIYCNRTTAPRVDEIVVAIDAEVRPLAPTASSETIGSAVVAFMCDPFMLPSEGIGQALAKAAAPPLCGVVHNQLIIRNRPTSPDDSGRLWVVSSEITPGLEWGVEIDEEQSKDYVAVSYSSLGHATIPDGTQRITSFPYLASNYLDRTGLIEGGDLTEYEANIAAYQAYYYLHRLAAGPVVIPYVCQNGYGQECAVDSIRQWDWVMNVGRSDAETAGPFLISEVTHQGHIASLTIGAEEAYSYTGPTRLPRKGRYIRGHWSSKKYRKRVSFETYWHWKYRNYYKKHHKYPKMPDMKKRPKYGYTTYRKWIEGRYTA